METFSNKYSTFIQLFIFVFIIGCSVVYYENFQSEMIYVKSTLDGNEYQVRNISDASNGSQQAANTLSYLRMKMLKLVEVVEKLEKEQKQDKYCNKAIDRLKERFDPKVMSESPSDAKYTSYSVNKGEKLYFCIRSKDPVDNNKLIDKNTLLFVSIHEMAHVMTKSIGHKPEFWNNFRFLLRVAIKNKIYYYQDFASRPQKYCGMEITDSPYDPQRDNNIKEILKEENEENSCR
jgi:hypothetical protein